MARYIYHYSELAELEGTQIQLEFEQFAKWITESDIDPDFDLEQHVYLNENGDRWIHIPELTSSQMFTMELILSSSSVTAA